MSYACRIGCRCTLCRVSKAELCGRLLEWNILLSSASSRGRKPSSSASLRADMTSCGEIVFLLLMRARSLELKHIVLVWTLKNCYCLQSSIRGSKAEPGAKRNESERTLKRYS